MQPNLNPIACEPCRSKKCKCDRTLYVQSTLSNHRPNLHRPACSQCHSPGLCRYQEGGKRGLPVAYMTSLENRLQETEAALLAAMNALRDRGGIGAIEVPVDGGEKTSCSKAEKQQRWKRWPLRSGEDLVAWCVEKEQQDVRARPEEPRSYQHRDGETSITHAVSDAGALDSSAHDHHFYASLGDVVEQLRSCKRPTAPNVSNSPTVSTAWLNNYF
jgi:hypothetical protein